MNKTKLLTVMGGTLKFPFNYFTGRSSTVGILGESVSGNYALIQKIDGDRVFCVPIRTFTSSAPLGSATEHFIYRPSFANLYSVEDDKANARITFTGTWPTVPDAALLGGDCTVSTTANDYLSFTTPAGTTRVGILYWQITNAGLAKVEIDGDATLATLLPTAQDLVTATTFPDTILVANGGTLNPTDRVLDQYINGNVRQKQQAFANDLTAGVHTVKMTNTGYKRAASSDDRLYIDGLMFGGNTEITTGLMAVEVLDEILYPSSSVFEYAISWQPESGETYTDFLGNGHGYDYQASLTPTVDGAAATPAYHNMVAGGNAKIVRVSNLKHPDVNGGADNIADVTTTYTMKPRTGLDVDVDITWLVAGKLGYSYPAMFPANESLFDIGKNSALSAGVALTNDNDTAQANGTGNVETMWKASGTGNYGIMLNIKNLAQATNNFTNTPVGQKFWIQDITGGLFNKMYLSRVVGAGVYETVSINDKIISNNNYRGQYFALGSNQYLNR